MNADQLEILCKGLEDAITGLETMIQFSKTQADRIAELEKQTKPLSDDEIKELIVNKVTDFELCRAIEERHGIK